MSKFLGTPEIQEGQPIKGDFTLVVHGQSVPDPFHGFSDPQSSQTLAYIRQQEEKYKAAIGKIPLETPAPDDAAPAKGIPTPLGNQYLFYYKGAADKTARLMLSDTPGGEGSVLIDPARDGDRPGQEIQSVHPTADGRYVAYRVGTNGIWESPVKIRDVERGEDIPDVIPKAATVWWDKDGKGFHYNLLSEDKPVRVIIKHHTLFEDMSKDTVMYDDPQNPGRAGGFAHGSYRGHYKYAGDDEFFFVGSHDMKADVFLKDKVTGEYGKLVEGDAYHVPVARTEDGILFYTTGGAPNGKLVLVDPENPARENWKTVIPEDRNDCLQHAFFQNGKVFGVYTRDCADEVRIFDTTGAAEGKIPLPPQSSVILAHSNFGGVSMGSRGDSNDLMLSVSGYQRPDTIYKYDIGAKTFEPVDPLPEKQGLEDCIVERIFATSRDGTKVPMTVIRSKDTALDGTAALRLDAYGAHGAVTRPHFDGEIADFVRAGGIYVQAAVRGGGEFGEAWHEAGSGLNKNNSFDDYIACAKHLAAGQYTSSSRIIATGHSSGGLLVLASMVKAPDAFGAVIAGSPVADMIRENPQWVKEYGDAYASKADFDNMKGYCPRLNIRDGVSYPPCLVRTGIHDKGLLPDACKFVATLQDKSPQSQALLHVEMDYGHATARPKDVELAERAAKKAFIEQAIGPIDQQAFRQELEQGLRSLATAGKRGPVADEPYARRAP
ncbi:MAG: prolyl oligopeptidase family serine peptidase [Alphaproteobacteria bacterium]